MIFTSEQVSNGHPDKICDQISDAIVTFCLQHDKSSRVGVETLIKDYQVVLAGEVTTSVIVPYTSLVREVLARVGIENITRYHVTNFVKKQSPDIARGVDVGGAGDQGMMFGYATDETPELLPIPYVLATKALLKLKKMHYPGIKPDAKCQVSYDYTKDRITTFLISTQHAEELRPVELYKVVKDVMVETANEYGLNTDFDVLINPTGRFVIGGSFADSGVTGRKIIADTYGGMARHGGGAFSGKDPSKVDRSGAYMARKLAREIVKQGAAKKCEIQISYAIGVQKPVSVYVECFGTEMVSMIDIEHYIDRFDLTPNGIIKYLGLLNVDYNRTSAYGHFGKSDLPWEN